MTETNQFRQKIAFVKDEINGREDQRSVGREDDLLDNLSIAAESIDRWIGRCEAMEKSVVRLREQLQRNLIKPDV